MFKPSARTLNKLEWLVIIYDKPGVDRLKYRDLHLQKIPELISTGVVSNAGPIFQDIEKTKFIGSSFNLYADNESEVIKLLKQDIYAEKDIWDFENVIIHPYSVHTRIGHNDK